MTTEILAPLQCLLNLKIQQLFLFHWNIYLEVPSFIISFTTPLQVDISVKRNNLWILRLSAKELKFLFYLKPIFLDKYEKLKGKTLLKMFFKRQPTQ
jgi:hypothetical protein